jgi:uncharacterized damage-inducible protein DinB
MTDPTTLHFLWRYMAHADQEIARAAATVPDDAYRRDQHISFGSIEKLLAHCMAAQSVWLQRLNGIDIPYKDVPPPPRAALAQHWANIHDELLTFAAAQTPGSLREPLSFHNRAGHAHTAPRGALMLHVADHATYHRGQLNSMIKLAGGTPSPVMLYPFAISHAL